MNKRKGSHRLTLVLIAIMLAMVFAPLSAMADGLVFSMPFVKDLPFVKSAQSSESVSLFSAGGVRLLSEESPSFTARVSYTVNSVTASYDSEQKASVTFTLSKACSAQVSFDYKVLFGSADDYLLAQSDGTVTFKADDTEETVEIFVKALVNNPTATEERPKASDPEEFWKGERIFYISCTNIKNALFGGDKIEQLIPVRITNNTDFGTLYNNVYISLGDTTDYTVSEGEIRLSSTIDEDGAVRKLLDTGVFSHVVLPYGTISGGEAGSSINIKIGNSGLGSVTLDGKGEAALDWEPTAHEGFGVASIGLGPNMEGNGIVTDLNLVFTGESGGSIALTSTTVSFNSPPQLRFTDNASPEVKSVLFAAGTAALGETIPVIVTFSEPVSADGTTLTIGSKTLTPEEATGTVSNKLSFLYKSELQHNGAVELNYTVSGARDINGKTLDGEGGGARGILSYTVATPSTERMLLAAAKSSVSLVQGTSKAMSGTFTLTLDNCAALRDWASDNADELSVKVTGVVPVISLEADNATQPTKLTGSFTAPENNTGAAASCVAELYLDEQLIYPLCCKFSVPPLTYADSNNLSLSYKNWPVTSRVAPSANNIAMGYSTSVALTWGSSGYFKWSSSDTSVATINEATGSIALTGKPGTVCFTLTVSNPITPDTPFVITGKTLTVFEESAVFLSVPEALQRLEVTSGGDACVSFSSNLTEKNAETASGAATDFTLTLYKAVYSGSAALPDKGEQTESYTQSSTTAKPVTSITVPASVLTEISAEGKYGYIAELSAASREAKAYTARVYIRVRPQPAKAILEKPAGLYITDDAGSAQIKYSIENYAAGSTQFALSVQKNSDAPLTIDAGSYSKTGSFEISKVDTSRLLDTYTVSLRAKNDSDAAWSTDSYTLYVYNADAMEILVNGKSETGFTLGLSADISKDISDKTSNELFALRHSLHKETRICLPKTYAWSNVADKLTWSVAPNAAGLALQYDDGGVLRTVDSETLCPPYRDIILEGREPGSYTVTATHALTGKTMTLPVTVEDSSSKLLYIQTSPQMPCIVTYYSNDREYARTAETSADGRLGLFEPSGIKGSVTVKPKAELSARRYNSTTLSASTLKANLSAWNETGIFPVNNVTLSSASYESKLGFGYINEKRFYEAYTGYVMVRSGLYLNGKYLEGVKYSGSGELCSEPRLIKPESDAEWIGEYCTTLSFDATTLPITAEGFDDIMAGGLELAVEVVACDKDGNPSETLLPIISRCYGRGDTLSFLPKADSFLPTGCSFIQPSLTIDGKRPNAQILQRLGDAPSSATLTMGMTLSQADVESYDIYLTDEDGVSVAKGTVSSTAEYPFSQFHTVSYTADITELIKNAKPGEILQLYPMVKKRDGTEQYCFSKPVRIQKMNNIPSLATMTNPGGAIDDLKSSIEKITDPKSMPKGLSDDDNTKRILNYLSDMKLMGSSFGIEVKETDDPLVYDATLRMAIGDFKSENPSGVFAASESSKNNSLTPGLSDIKPLELCSFLNKTTNAYIAGRESWKRNQKVYGGGAYMMGIVYFDAERQEWLFAPYTSSFYVGGGLSSSKAYNFKVGPVPVTVRSMIWGTSEVGLKMISNRPDGLDNAYIISLVPNLCLYVSGGVGFDYDVVSFWAGPYGVIYHQQHYLWQNWDDGWSNGQRLTIGGEAGVEIEVSLIVLDYSRRWKIATYEKNWKFNNYDAIAKNYGRSVFTHYAVGFSELEDEYVLVPVSESAAFESRDYLAQGESVWVNSSMPRLMSFEPGSTGSGLSTVLSNAYPKASPALTDDGGLMVYLHHMNSSDINATRACFALKSDGGFADGGAIDAETAHPDSSLTVAGTSANAAAAWVRCFNSITASAGDAATDEALLDMLAGTEIMVSTRNAAGWSAKRLTNDNRVDSAPALAAAGTRALAAWVSSAPGTLDNPLEYTNNRIMYAAYNGSWSEVKTLLDAGTDNVSDVRAAMLDGGSAAISYRIGSKVFCAVLNASGEVISTLSLSDADTGNSNVRLTATGFSDSASRYVIGWSSKDETVETDNGALRLAAVNADGTLYPDFSLELVGEDGYEGFEFSKGAETIDELSVLRTAVDTSGSTTGRLPTIVWGQKLTATTSGELTSYSAAQPQKLLELDGDTRLRSFDSAVSSDGNSFRFAIATSEADGTAQTSTISRADAQYKKLSISVDAPYFEYSEIIPGADAAVQFTVTNEGIEPITKIDIELDGKVTGFDGFSVHSGEAKPVTVLYSVPGTVKDAAYTVTARSGEATAEKAGTLPFALADIRIDSVELISEGGGKRNFSLSLGSLSGVPVKTGQRVRIQATAGSDFSEPLYDKYLSADEVSRLNADGSLGLGLTLDLRNADFAALLSDGELPKGGVFISFRALLEEGGNSIDDADSSNNSAFTQLKSLAEQSGREVSLASAMTTQDGKSSVRVEAFNNNLRDITNGNLVVTLLDADGTVLETQRTYTGSTASLLKIGGESSETAALSFSRAGASVSVSFARVSTGSSGGGDSGNDAPVNSPDAGGEAVATIEVKASESGGTASAEVSVQAAEKAISEALEKAGRESRAVVEISIEASADVKSVEATIPKEAVSRAALSGIDALTISSPIASVSLDAKTLAGLAKDGAGNLTVTASRVDTAALTDETRQRVGDRPVFDFSITSGEQSVSQFDGEVSVAVPYTLREGEDENAVVIYFINAAGKLEVVKNCVYNVDTGSIRFGTSHFSQYAIGYNKVRFVDVSERAWYSAAVDFIAARGITSGTSADTFSPADTLTRGQLITLILRAYDIEPDAQGAENFSDAGYSYYTGYLAAAKRMGIAEGVGENKFAPDAAITRQEVFTLLYNALSVLDRLPTGRSDRVLSDFGDSAAVADYAREALVFLVEAGRISGSGGLLLPGSQITRAETAQLLYNIMR